MVSAAVQLAIAAASMTCSVVEEGAAFTHADWFGVFEVFQMRA